MMMVNGYFKIDDGGSLRKTKEVCDLSVSLSVYRTSYHTRESAQLPRNSPRRDCIVPTALISTNSLSKTRMVNKS